MTKLAVVTGANKGIGFAIVKRLHKAGFQVVLTSRDEERGREAQSELKAQSVLVDYLQLDVENKESTQIAADKVQAMGGCDVLVCNAGIAWKGDAFDEEVARGTHSVNYFGARRCIETFLPAIKDGGRIVVVSSRAGDFSKLSKDLQEQFRGSKASLQNLDSLVNKFIDDVKTNKWQAEGWPKTAYGVSKMAITAYVNLVAPTLPRGITIYSMCPGWCKTDMAGDKAPRTADEGADTAEFLSTEDASALKSGKFYADRNQLPEWI
eukprot:m.80163 g.80163  ORF g.80163 m.80163 type:complete len:265 (-) comp14827_c0_seq1:393-1187(-)